jgi:hypothetical protein
MAFDRDGANIFIDYFHLCCLEIMLVPEQEFKHNCGAAIIIVCIRADSVKGLWLLSQHVNK